MRTLPAILATTLCFLWVPFVSNVQADVRSDDVVEISSDEVIEDDVYIFANRVVVDGLIKGDLVAVCREIVIKGTVEGDLNTVAQNVQIDGAILDDARVGSQIISLKANAHVGDDLIAGAFSLECAQGSQIGGEVKFGGFQSLFAGEIKGNLQSATANCQLAGTFGKDVHVTVDGEGASPPPMWGAPPFPVVPGGLTISETAEIAGNLNYRSTREAVIEPGASIAGGVNFSRIVSAETRPPTVVTRILSSVRRFVALLLIGLIIVFACPKWTGRIVDTVQRQPLGSLGWGVVTLVGAIVSVILLIIITVAVAILLGFLSLENLLPAWLAVGLFSTVGVVLGLAVFTTWIAKIIVSAWLGNRIFNGDRWKPSKRFLTLASGLGIFVVVSAVPALGLLVSIAVTLIGLGSASICLFGLPKFPGGRPTDVPVKEAV